MGADTTLLAGGRLLSGDHVDVLVRDGRIADIGAAIRAPYDVRLDLDGRVLAPGLWDHHVHFSQWALMRQRLDLSAAASAVAAAAVVAARVRAEYDTTAPLIGFGFRDSLWPDAATAEVLDEAAPVRPVVILSGDMHACWVNTAAQRWYRLPTAGVLREDDAFALQLQLEKGSADDEDRLISDAALAAAGRGVVGIVDLEMHDNLAAWTRRMHRGLRALRVRSGFYPEHLQARIDEGWHTGDIVPGTGGLLTVGALKLITDGSLNTRTAYCHEPYPALPTRGRLTIPLDTSTSLLRRAHAHGFQAAVHAIGDAAVTAALDAFAASGARGTIEHAQLMLRTDLPRLVQLGVVASVQPAHLWDDRDATDRTWPDRADRAFPLRALYDADATLVFGSDAPVSPLDPWFAIAAAEHRSADDREPWHPQHALTRAQALDAAGLLRPLAVGDPADMVVLDEDPVSADLAVVKHMPVAVTMTAGLLTHAAL